jgi:hypothetical protein
MKTIKIIPILMLVVLASCSSVHVASDYDKKADFGKYKTYAFYKTGIDKVEISDLDKKRILRSIEEVMTAKGFTKSETPDLLINFFTKSREQVNVHNGYGYGYGFGWNPWMWGGGASVYTNTEGSLFIDLIDAAKKDLVWQGEGVGILTENAGDKDERIKEFVTKILSQYPPGADKKK